MKNKGILEIKAEVFNALAHPLRLKILEKLRNGPCCVCRIIPYVSGEQSNVSHHLAILKKASILHCEKRGLEVWYEVVDPTIFDVIDALDECLIKHLERDQKVLMTLVKERK